MSTEQYPIYIKNMVCPRCITAVKNVLINLDLPFHQITLGKVDLIHALNEFQRLQLEKDLNILGFELLESGKSILISKIKTLIIDQIHHTYSPLGENYSSFISQNLYHEYSYLSRLFSSVEGITIEKFISKQKIEKVKELLFYNELSLSEIAFQLDYSSVSYLSTQFKKETGMTTTEFKSIHKPVHKNIDSI